MGQIFSSDCDRAREHISVRLDRELAELDGIRLQAHLAGCAACRAYEAAASAAARVMRDTPLEQVSVPFLLPSRRLALARRLQVAAAAAALLVTIGLSAAVGTVAPSPRAHHTSVRTAKNLRFPEQELRMLQRASHARTSRASHGRIAF
jgi:predicted anti-sigma-YlaC factor YlaD